MKFVRWLNWIMVACILVLVVVGIDAANGTERNDPPVVHHNDVTTLTGGSTTITSDSIVNANPIINAGDTNIGGSSSKAYALAPPNLADVDIAECLGSTSWSLIVGAKQKLQLNHVCMAEFYLKMARYDLAAQSLCNQPEILSEYEDEVGCEADHDFSPGEITESPVLAELYDRAAMYEEEEEEHDEQIAQLQEQYAELVQQRSRPAPKPLLSSKQRAALEEVLK